MFDNVCLGLTPETLYTASNMGGPMRLGEALKGIREKKFKLTQDSFAKEFGLSRSLVVGIERGATTSSATLEKILKKLDEDSKKLLMDTPEAQKILGLNETEPKEPRVDETEDMIGILKKLRRTDDADLSGTWNAMWLTTARGSENRNREIIHFQQRWNGSWQLTNEAISQEP
jgi:transcriptional regulator with XRE-family HTH domain